MLATSTTTWSAGFARRPNGRTDHSARPFTATG
jgi:hypothetical protein